ncbi:MAG: aminoglycoside phosphotransferase family protein [Thermomicrobia bacterium]|nr:aminoglycoside phosphotransferase family protein [Thermomicrobia bacterium]
MADFAAALQPQVLGYLNRADRRAVVGFAPDEPLAITILAQGEYNLNYLVTGGARQVVARINTGTQAGISDQIGYEYRALEFLRPAGIAPAPFLLDNSGAEIPYGFLVEEYFPGRPLDYATEVPLAARTIAALHTVPTAGHPDFLVVPDPLTGSWQEAKGYLDCFFATDDGDATVKRIFARVLATLQETAAKQQGRFRPEERVITHTDVQAHNFVVGESAARAKLVDWEKPMLDDGSYDLCHFLTPTSTSWKCDYVLSDAQRTAFVETYATAVGDHHAGRALSGRIEARMPFVYLRATGWCAMAWVEYTRPGRLLRNEKTFEKIIEYLVPDFLVNLFRPYVPGL